MSRSPASLLHQKLQQVFRERNEGDHTEKLSSNKQKKANKVNFNTSNLWSYPVRMKVVGKERWTKSSNAVKHLGNTHTHTHRLTSTHLCAQLGSPHRHLLIPYRFQVHPSHMHLITQHTYIVSIQTYAPKHSAAGVCACLCVCVMKLNRSFKHGLVPLLKPYDSQFYYQ